MKQKETSELTEQQLPEKAKKVKLNAFMNAALIGVMAGIIIWSVAKNNVGFFTLIPLFFIYKMVNKDKASKDQDLK